MHAARWFPVVSSVIASAERASNPEQKSGMGVDEVVPGRVAARGIAGSEQLMKDHQTITVHAGRRKRVFPGGGYWGHPRTLV